MADYGLINIFELFCLYITIVCLLMMYNNSSIIKHVLYYNLFFSPDIIKKNYKMETDVKFKVGYGFNIGRNYI